MSTADDEHRECVIAKLEELKLLEYDWDGSTGLPIREDVYELVKDVFSCAVIPDYLLARLNAPDMALSGDGTVELAYIDDETDRQVFITFECANVITWIKVFGDEVSTIEGLIRLEHPDRSWDAVNFEDLRELFEWIWEQ